jgi:hypothetical protein
LHEYQNKGLANWVVARHLFLGTYNREDAATKVNEVLPPSFSVSVDSKGITLVFLDLESGGPPCGSSCQKEKRQQGCRTPNMLLPIDDSTREYLGGQEKSFEFLVLSDSEIGKLLILRLGRYGILGRVTERRLEIALL